MPSSTSFSEDKYINLFLTTTSTNTTI